jgi:hypothetical protein
MTISGLIRTWLVCHDFERTNGSVIVVSSGVVIGVGQYMRRLVFFAVASLLGGIWSHFVWIYRVQALNQTPPPEEVFRPGTSGVGYPRCLYCPAPKLPATPKEANPASLVALEAIVRPNGRATDIKVIKGSGSNLDEKLSRPSSIGGLNLRLTRMGSPSRHSPPSS